jgi:hypothetical protein
MFHSETYEKADLNQYWYSEKTCETLLAAVSECISWKGARVAFLSTPSLFFSLSAEERKQCTLFEFDKSWESCSNVIFYDFNHPTNIDAKLHGKFDVSSSRRFVLIHALPLHTYFNHLPFFIHR